MVGGAGGIVDPELSRYIAQCHGLIRPNFNPLPAVLSAHPEYEVDVYVKIGAGGKLTTPKIVRGTGDPSFDNAAISAVARTGSLPIPPGKWREIFATKGLIITLSAKDAQ